MADVTMLHIKTHSPGAATSPMRPNVVLRCPRGVQPCAASPRVHVALLLFVLTATLLVTACGSSRSADPTKVPPRPLPVGVLVGVDVVVYPLTMILAERALEWDLDIAPRETALRKADSLIVAALTSRTPEVTWVPPEALRRAARSAPGLLSNPDRMGTAALRHNLSRIPDPLRSQMRSLTGVAGDRFALVPASLFFFVDETGEGEGRAELTMVLADVRLGEIRWRSVARGVGMTPWMALAAALETLAPGLP